MFTLLSVLHVFNLKNTKFGMLITIGVKFLLAIVLHILSHVTLFARNLAGALPKFNMNLKQSCAILILLLKSVFVFLYRNIF